MANHITLQPAVGTHVVRAGKTVIGTTKRAVELREGTYGLVHYVPRDDIDMTRLERSTRTTTCPWKGVANYYSVTTPEGRLDNAVWTYETPKAGLEGIAGHLAFYPSVTVTPA
ncbi:MAG: DUF427 domain-containing protein [Pseudomonadota bacterium]